MSNYQFLFKYIIVGDSGVGKSCLTSQFLENKFSEKHNVTIGVEFGAKIINVKEESIKLQIWDTAGQESFRCITRSYYRSAAGAILVYDLTRKETFDHIEKWLEEAKNNGNETMTFILVGNKSDMEQQREVSFDDASDFAQKNQIIYIETSAKTGFNVAEVFQKSAEEIYYKIQNHEIDLSNETCGIRRYDGTILTIQNPTNNNNQYDQKSYCC